MINKTSLILLLVIFSISTNTHARIGKTKSGNEGIYGRIYKNYRNRTVHITKKHFIFCHYDNLVCDVVIFNSMRAQKFTEGEIAAILKLNRDSHWKKENHKNGTLYKSYTLKALHVEGKYGDFIVFAFDIKDIEKHLWFPKWYFEN